MQARIKSLIGTGLLLLGASVPAAAQETPPGAETASAIELEIAQEEAQIAALEELEQAWRRQAEVEEASLARRLEAVVTLQAQLGDADEGDPVVERVFDQVKPLARQVLSELAAAIDVLQRPSELTARGPARRGRDSGSSFGAGRGASGGRLSASAAAEKLVELDRREKDKLAELERLEIEGRLESLERHIELAARIWDLREDALHMLPADRRDEVFSFEGEGLEETRLELRALAVVWRLQLLRGRALIVLAGGELGSLVRAFRFGAMTLKLLLVFVLWRWAQRNRSHYIARLEAKTADIEDERQRQRARSGVEFLTALGPWVIFLAGLGALRWTLGESVEAVPGIEALLVILAIYGVYRLIADMAVGVLSSSMMRAGMDVSEGLKTSLTRRVRWVLRVATIAGVAVALVELRLGRGVLHAHLTMIGWTAALGLLFLVLGGLREEISDLFLATRAKGKLARLVRKTRDRFSGRLVAPLAFIWLTAWSLFSLLRNLLFSFEQTRSASAYLSRRRLEKSAERTGYASGSLEAVPGVLLEGLDSTVQLTDAAALDRFVGMDVARESVAAWREGVGGGSLLLSGDEGVGKRAWVSRFVELEKVESRAELGRRLMNGRALLRWLSSEFLGEDAVSTRAELVSRIEEDPRRIFVIERAERLFLSTVNGYHALAELGPLVDATRHKIFWVLSIGGLAWNHLRAAGKDLAFLRRQLELPAWSEPEITELIRLRLARAGYDASYASLMVGEGRHEDLQVRQRQGEQAYMNLLWDFAGGNPKVALHYYARSLSDGDGALRVRPFRRPPEEELEATDDSALFILAALARHGSLTPREAARATDYQVDRVQARLVRLQDHDVITATGGSFRVTTAWRSTVLRVLRRHNILIA